MEFQEILKETLTSWAATRSDEVVWNYKDGFYSFAIVAEAFEKGKEFGELRLKENARKRFFDSAVLMNKALITVLKPLLEKKFPLHKLFISHGVNQSKVLISLDEAIHDKKDFIDFAYPLVSAIEAEYLDKGLNIDISFLDQNEHLSMEAIINDGFGFAFDIDKGIEIQL